VVIGDKVLVTVTNADSKLHKTSHEKLAKIWAKNVAKHIESVTPLN
jgi:predicted dinucleotide-binding enzyme